MKWQLSFTGARGERVVYVVNFFYELQELIEKFDLEEHWTKDVTVVQVY